MSAVPTEIWPWLALAGLGLFHGLNPAMGWLFAVALGLHRGSQRIVLLSLVPIAVGHAAAVAAVLLAVVALGLVIDHTMLIRLAAIVLIAWAAWHALYGHQRRVRVGVQTGLLGLVLWSFLMASAPGAGADLRLRGVGARGERRRSPRARRARRSFRRNARNHRRGFAHRLPLDRSRFSATGMGQPRLDLGRCARPMRGHFTVRVARQQDHRFQELPPQFRESRAPKLSITCVIVVD